jgi:hypothetical protein
MITLSTVQFQACLIIRAEIKQMRVITVLSAALTKQLAGTLRNKVSRLQIVNRTTA